MQETVGAKAQVTATAIDGYVHDKPWTAMGFAAVLGIAIGLLVGRR